jgi:dimethylsulfone monooxygenase
MKTQFAYWIPNITGRTISNKIIQRPSFNFDYNAQLAQTSEEVGFDYAVSQISSIDSYGANSQLEALATTIGLIRKTERLKAIASVIPGLCHPGIVAKMAANIDFATNGRFCVNVINGFFKDEFLEQRYLRCQDEKLKPAII